MSDPRYWKENGWHCVGICRTCWDKGVETTWKKRWQLRWADEHNDVAPMSFVNVGPTKLPTKCQQWPNE